MGSQTTSPFSLGISIQESLKEKATEILGGPRSLLAWAPFFAAPHTGHRTSWTEL
jgi:hypothetical protein